MVFQNKNKFQSFLQRATWSFPSRQATWPFGSDVSSLMHPSEVSLATTSVKQIESPSVGQLRLFDEHKQTTIKGPVNWLLSCSSGWEGSQLGSGEGALRGSWEQERQELGGRFFMMKPFEAPDLKRTSTSDQISPPTFQQQLPFRHTDRACRQTERRV